jgi:hypothetical protein
MNYREPAALNGFRLCFLFIGFLFGASVGRCPVRGFLHFHFSIAGVEGRKAGNGVLEGSATLVRGCFGVEGSVQRFRFTLKAGWFGPSLRACARHHNFTTFIPFPKARAQVLPLEIGVIVVVVVC